MRFRFQPGSFASTWLVATTVAKSEAFCADAPARLRKCLPFDLAVRQAVRNWLIVVGTSIPRSARTSVWYMTPTGTTANGRAVSLPWRQKNGLFAGASGSVFTHGRFARFAT